MRCDRSWEGSQPLPRPAALPTLIHFLCGNLPSILPHGRQPPVRLSVDKDCLIFSFDIHLPQAGAWTIPLVNHMHYLLNYPDLWLTWEISNVDSSHIRSPNHSYFIHTISLSLHIWFISQTRKQRHGEVQSNVVQEHPWELRPSDSEFRILIHLHRDMECSQKTKLRVRNGFPETTVFALEDKGQIKDGFETGRGGGWERRERR